jgi:dissimilatory sulfite reductase (desulfoviridin) alpha/beta subunit
MNRRDRDKIEPRVLDLLQRCGFEKYTEVAYDDSEVERVSGLYESLISFYKNAYIDGKASAYGRLWK